MPAAHAGRRVQSRAGTVADCRSADFHSCPRTRTAPPEAEHRYVGRGANIERPAVPQEGVHARGIHRGARHDFVDRHAEVQQFRHDVRKIDDARCVSARRAGIGGDCVGPESRLHDAIEGIPEEMSRSPVGDVKPDAAAPGGEDGREDTPVVVDDGVWRWCKHVRHDVARFQQVDQVRER